MGHYAAEMMCNACGQVRCRCVKKKIDYRNWIVDDLGITVGQWREQEIARIRSEVKDQLKQTLQLSCLDLQIAFMKKSPPK